MVDLQTGRILSTSGANQIYFPINGLISILSLGDVTPNFEVGMVGREGMYGIPFALGLKSTDFHASVLYPGQAWSISTTVFRTELHHNRGLQLALNRYINIVIEQLYNTCRCIKFHTLSERLAKWLLMSQDRSNALEFSITQETLASLLGVRRVGITAAANQLRSNGIIEYSRGHVTILNRKHLEKQACSCYLDETKLYTKTL
ncbi:Crp/Fnr family transcriptional regulator [Herbaspirillum robiniae]|uniref:Crp/Fnr family transcriptional regulator n=1 Tax=Herbaspirillum robiniae TaxID=2014887 RepID=A0A246WQZ6_9BURK|nr:Crp/Fnr family transcriptional regulator [Herbaspirillum robiniae]